jgi:hypothetical protein
MASYGDSLPSLANTELLATTDVIRTQMPTPIVLKLYDNAARVAPSTLPSAKLTVIAQKNQAVDTATRFTPVNKIQWHEAAAHIGQSMLVCGPVAGTHNASTIVGSPTLINLGVDYPNAQRFTIVIWGSNQANFTSPPEQYYLGKTLCVGGIINLFQGTADIEVSKPGQIEIKR